MTNDVIEGSRHESYESQKNLVKGKTNNECELPTYLEALTACVMHHVIYGEHLLGRESYTNTHCQDLIEELHPVIVGGSGDLLVNFYFADDIIVVAACRKFC